MTRHRRRSSLVSFLLVAGFGLHSAEALPVTKTLSLTGDDWVLLKSDKPEVSVYQSAKVELRFCEFEDSHESLETLFEPSFWATSPEAFANTGLGKASKTSFFGRPAMSLNSEINQKSLSFFLVHDEASSRWLSLLRTDSTPEKLNKPLSTDSLLKWDPEGRQSINEIMWTPGLGLLQFALLDNTPDTNVEYSVRTSESDSLTLQRSGSLRQGLLKLKAFNSRLKKMEAGRLVDADLPPKHYSRFLGIWLLQNEQIIEHRTMLVGY